jgi:tetratricopeptide (TPR) repeat protein
MTKLKLFSLLAAAALMPASLLAQNASIHGHVNNAAGMPAAGTVALTQERTAPTKDMKFKNTFTVDKTGDYKGTGIVPGDYLVYFMANGVAVDRLEITFKKDEDAAADFDMTRKEFIDRMSPEDKAALEEYKKHASEAIKANSVIANLNNALKTVHADLATPTPNYDQDIKTMQDATAQKPDEAVLWYNLGAVQIASADAKMKAAHAAKQSWQSDESIAKQYNDGIDSYKKGIALNDASKKPNPADAGVAWNAIGNADAKMGKAPEAQEAFDNAVKVSPASAGMVYGNEAAVLFNAGQGDAAAAAADKAIAADPTRAEPYFIKGQSLVAKATVDASGKIVAPPGCIEAYQKYLELAPDGPHAQDVKDVLSGMGQSITTTYKAPGTKSSKAPAKK